MRRSKPTRLERDLRKAMRGWIKANSTRKLAKLAETQEGTIRLFMRDEKGMTLHVAGRIADIVGVKLSGE